MPRSVSEPGQRLLDGAALPERDVHQYLVLAIDRRDGRIVWERVAGERQPHEATHASSGTYASSSDITDSGAIVWSHGRDTPYVSSPLLYDDALYFTKYVHGILSVFDAKAGRRTTGRSAWRECGASWRRRWRLCRVRSYSLIRSQVMTPCTIRPSSSMRAGGRSVRCVSVSSKKRCASVPAPPGLKLPIRWCTR